MEKLYQIENEFNNLEQEANEIFSEANEELSHNLEVEMLELNHKAESLLKTANEGLNKIETLSQELKVLKALEELDTAKEMTNLINIELTQIGLEDFKIEFNSLEEKTIAIESISDTISKIWEGFKKMVKKIVDFLFKIIDKFLSFLGLGSNNAIKNSELKKLIKAYETEKEYIPKIVSAIKGCKTKEDIDNKVRPIAESLIKAMEIMIEDTENNLVMNELKKRVNYLKDFVNNNNGKSLFLFLSELLFDPRITYKDLSDARDVLKKIYNLKKKEQKQNNAESTKDGTLLKNVNLNGFRVGNDQAKLDIEIIAAGMAGIKDYDTLVLEDKTILTVIDFFLENKNNNLSDLKENCHIDSKVKTKTLTVYTGNSILKVEYGFDKDIIILKEAEKKIDISRKNLLLKDLTNYVDLVGSADKLKEAIKKKTSEIKTDLKEITKIANSSPGDTDKAKCTAKNGQELLRYLQNYISNLTKLGNVLKKYDCLYVNQKFTI